MMKNEVFYLKSLGSRQLISLYSDDMKLTSISGLSELNGEVGVQETGLQTNDELVTSSINPRDITLKFDILALDKKTLFTKLQRYFKAGEDICFYIGEHFLDIGDEGDCAGVIRGVISEISSQRFSKKVTVTIKIHCVNPYWYACRGNDIDVINTSFFSDDNVYSRGVTTSDWVTMNSGSTDVLLPIDIHGDVKSPLRVEVEWEGVEEKDDYSGKEVLSPIVLSVDEQKITLKRSSNNIPYYFGTKGKLTLYTDKGYKKAVLNKAIYMKQGSYANQYDYGKVVNFIARNGNTLYYGASDGNVGVSSNEYLIPDKWFEPTVESSVNDIEFLSDGSVLFFYPQLSFHKTQVRQLTKGSDGNYTLSDGYWLEGQLSQDNDPLESSLVVIGDDKYSVANGNAFKNNSQINVEPYPESTKWCFLNNIPTQLYTNKTVDQDGTWVVSTKNISTGTTTCIACKGSLATTGEMYTLNIATDNPTWVNCATPRVFNKIVEHNSVFYAFQNSDTVIYSSTDGSTWTALNVSFAGAITSIACGENYLYVLTTKPTYSSGNTLVENYGYSVNLETLTIYNQKRFRYADTGVKGSITQIYGNMVVENGILAVWFGYIVTYTYNNLSINKRFHYAESYGDNGEFTNESGFFEGSGNDVYLGGNNGGIFLYYNPYLPGVRAKLYRIDSDGVLQTLTEVTDNLYPCYYDGNNGLYCNRNNVSTVRLDLTSFETTTINNKICTYADFADGEYDILKFKIAPENTVFKYVLSNGSEAFFYAITNGEMCVYKYNESTEVWTLVKTDENFPVKKPIKVTDTTYIGLNANYDVVILSNFVNIIKHNVNMGETSSLFRLQNSTDDNVVMLQYYVSVIKKYRVDKLVVSDTGFTVYDYLKNLPSSKSIIAVEKSNIGDYTDASRWYVNTESKMYNSSLEITEVTDENLPSYFENIKDITTAELWVNPAIKALIDSLKVSVNSQIAGKIKVTAYYKERWI